MNPYLEEADEELKRADHLLYVSLKYTRTVDIIKSIVERLINMFDFSIMALITMMKEKGTLDNIPKSPGFRASIVAERYKDEPVIQEFLAFYHHLREVSRAEFKRSSEFRRHVKMTSMLDSGPVEIDIDKISEYYHKSRVFAGLIKQVVITTEESKEPPVIDMQALKESVSNELEFNKGGGN